MSPRDTLTKPEKRKILRLRARLLKWYTENRRKFPWRKASASNYERICVEVLLQRTRAETVAAQYDVFFGRFADWKDLHAAKSVEIENYLKPIGLWKRRAIALKGLSKFAATHGGQFPDDETELQKIPAVGQYVSNAILLFQHDVPRPLIDVNMARVLERFVRPRRLVDIRHDPWLQEAAGYLVKCGQAKNVNWACLDYAATICTSRHPNCNQCVIKRGCNLLKQGVAA